MGKKRSDDRASEGKGKQKFVAFSIFDHTFDNIDEKTVKRNILILILVSLAAKALMLIATISVFNSFIDLFDIGYYLNHAVMLLQGQIPYVSYSFEYPVLFFVPTILALIPTILTQNAMMFAYTFSFLMVLCDIVTLVCVYCIALRIWGEKTAFLAGLMYATAFSTAYFVLTKYDAFPTAFLMAALLLTIYGMTKKGYLSATLGFFAKIFPAAALPFMILYNAKSTSLKEEILSALKIGIPVVVVLFLPFLIFGPDTISSYFTSAGSSRSVYANSPTYTLYVWLHDIGHLGVTPDMISIGMYILMAIALVGLLVIAFRDTAQNPVTLLKLLLCTIFALVFFAKFHSPQYAVWFAPLLVLLAADDLIKIALFVVTQVFAYIEFPLMFGSYYVNLQYTNPAGSAGWYLTLVFFTLEYLALLLLIYLIIRPQDGVLKKIDAIIHPASQK